MNELLLRVERVDGASAASLNDD